MLASLIAERYAKALLNAGRAEGSLKELGAQAALLHQGLLGAASASSFLSDPVTPAAKKLEALQGVFAKGLHPLLRRLIAAMLENKRSAFITGTLGDFVRRCKAESGSVEATVSTARELKSAHRRLLEKGLSEKLGRQVELEPLVDTSLLGGAILRVGDTIYDGSLRSQLAKLGRILAQGPILKPVPPKAPLKPVPAKAAKNAKAKGKVKAAKKPKAVSRPAATKTKLSKKK